MDGIRAMPIPILKFVFVVFVGPSAGKIVLCRALAIFRYLFFFKMEAKYQLRKGLVRFSPPSLANSTRQCRCVLTLSIDEEGQNEGTQANEECKRLIYNNPFLLGAQLKNGDREENDTVSYCVSVLRMTLNSTNTVYISNSNVSYCRLIIPISISIVGPMYECQFSLL